MSHNLKSLGSLGFLIFWMLGLIDDEEEKLYAKCPDCGNIISESNTIDLTDGKPHFFRCVPCSRKLALQDEPCIIGNTR